MFMINHILKRLLLNCRRTEEGIYLVYYGLQSRLFYANGSQKKDKQLYEQENCNMELINKVGDGEKGMQK